MQDSALFGLGFLALLTLSACADPEPAATAAAPADMTGWRLVSGKTPSKAEFAALTATCEEQAKGSPLDTCLATLGLKRGQ